MLLQPKKFKFKKLKKNFLKHPLESKACRLRKGDIGLKALESGRISARQLEAARQAINRHIKRKGKLWVSVFPSIPVTKTPNENRMGKGKGGVHFWCAPVKVGMVLFEISGNALRLAHQALKKGGHKLPVKTKIIVLDEQAEGDF